MSSPDERYLKLLLDPLDKCADYKPKFGSSDEAGVTLEQFKARYSADPFYHWVGLDEDLMYAAHKAAGGMTSIYRQLGHGAERLFRAVIRDSLELSEEQVSWSYRVKRQDGTLRTLHLDARIDVDYFQDQSAERRKIADWLGRCAGALGYGEKRARQLRGAVFEVRQGYKSADAKRQNADLQFANNAVAENYLPVLSVVSTQVSDTVARRYRNAKMLVATGYESDDDTASTYAFFRNVVGFELDSFFARNSERMRERCMAVLNKLLSPA